MKLLQTIQEELKPWQAHNFPNRQSWIPLLGAVEEFGELCEAHENGIPNIEKVKDASTDILVYICDYCNAIGISASDCYEDHLEDKCKLHPSQMIPIMLGRISHAHIKLEQKIRINEQHNKNRYNAIGVLIGQVFLCCAKYKIDLELAAKLEWDKVKQRDWILYPKNGLNE